jgi:hypothetical protein
MGADGWVEKAEEESINSVAFVGCDKLWQDMPLLSLRFS